MLIRRATASDIDALTAALLESRDEFVRFRYGPPEEAKPLPKSSVRESVRKEIDNKTGLFLIAEDKETIAGFMNVLFDSQKDFLFENNPTGDIKHLWVRKGFRRKGVATVLRDYAIMWFKKKGCKQLRLRVSNKNPQARAVYLKWGFEPSSTVMRKKI
jgi:GNAT superfamily N-acetyltransferase